MKSKTANFAEYQSIFALLGHIWRRSLVYSGTVKDIRICVFLLKTCISESFYARVQFVLAELYYQHNRDLNSFSLTRTASETKYSDWDADDTIKDDSYRQAADPS